MTALAALFLFPATSFAGADGTYKLDTAKMMEFVINRMKKRGMPEKRIAMMKERIKARMSMRKMWMVLTKDGKFKGMSQKGKKKPELGATGSWAQKGKTLTVTSVSIKNKRKSTISCEVSAKKLKCHDIKRPTMHIHFIKTK
ncbi:MAG: hypothetical protein CL920_03750 [Deltaproteobacteria bacterium]|nr:hypothetical protein [Deltaproteobacteria bacterium]